MNNKGFLEILSIVFIIIFALIVYAFSWVFQDYGRVKNPLTEKELVEYVQKELGDDVDVTIEKKYSIPYDCKGNFDGSCLGKIKLHDVYGYHLKIVNKEDSDIASEAEYRDGYNIYSSIFSSAPSYTEEPDFSSEYEDIKKRKLCHKNNENVISRYYDNYTNNGSEFLLVTDNLDKLKNTIDELNKNNPDNSINCEATIYILKDLKYYDADRFLNCTKDKYVYDDNGLIRCYNTSGIEDNGYHVIATFYIINNDFDYFTNSDKYLDLSNKPYLYNYDYPIFVYQTNSKYMTFYGMKK